MRGRNTSRTHHGSFSPPPPHGTQNFKMEQFSYWHIFMQTNIWFWAYSYLHYNLHIFSLQENLNVLLTAFYSHIIRRQTKKCYDWTPSQDTTDCNSSVFFCSQDWKISTHVLSSVIPLLASRVIYKLKTERDNAVSWSKQAHNWLPTPFSSI